MFPATQAIKLVGRHAARKLNDFRFHQSGFTLIELLITLSLITILLALAAPSFRNVIHNMAASRLTNEFVLSATYARGQAIARNRCVTLCLSDNPNDDVPVCSASSTDWSAGWIVFTNPLCDNNAADPTAELLQIYAGDVSGPTLTPASSGSAYRAIRFDAKGLAGLAGARNLIVTNGSDTQFSRLICIGSGGRVSVASGSATTCLN